ncbi:hypothetical protein M408DRAFT_12145 [Serendipita vermifera MAFF 305830]|uniref:F-box domain-containing protein n=1 Tax=Serendipita vermifera MAFF 305830 TaxID=933852 RepID=A0A0C2W730_SERVB|nr:hypothetical protein M408DRAFT_12145 [Serendipita vermifera MAFF 305830]
MSSRAIVVLPPELWRIILRLVEEPHLSPHSYCNHLNFGNIICHFDSPHDCPPPRSPWIRQLRLVCRAFNAIIESPFFFMEKDVDESSIPAVARVIYFNRFQAGSVSLQRLLKEPIRCDQVVTLDMPRCDDPAKLTFTGFDLLCEKADLFPRVRSLSLGFTSKTSIFPDFWTCLYEALPRLKCLFLRGRVPDFLPRSVRFEELEVVDLEKPTIDFAFHFPAVRHAAFCRFYPANMPTFKDIPRLESLLLRIVVYLAPFNWETLPNLRFLGVSAQQLNAFAPLPPNHPLHHFPWVRRLRLVCRLFDAILQNALFFMDKDVNLLPIPAVAREIYFHPCQDAPVSLQRLLKEPVRCNQVVTLDIPRSHDRWNLLLFGLFCKNAYLFPKLQSLTLSTADQAHARPDIWSRLYEAFPHLKCLYYEEEFEELEVVDFEYPVIGFAFHFPAVRHVAFGHLTPWNTPDFEAIAQLESLLLRSVNFRAPLDLNALPSLRFLGVPARQLNAFGPLPPNHPLRHLYVYVGTVPRNDHTGHPNRDFDQSEWIKQTMRHFPSITRLTLLFSSGENWLVDWIDGYFKEEDRELLGLEIQSSSHGYQRVNRRVVYRHDLTIAKPAVKEPEPQTQEKSSGVSSFDSSKNHTSVPIPTLTTSTLGTSSTTLILHTTVLHRGAHGSVSSDSFAGHSAQFSRVRFSLWTRMWTNYQFQLRLELFTLIAFKPVQCHSTDC